MHSELSWKNFFDTDLSQDASIVVTFLTSFDIKQGNKAHNSSILRECVRLHPNSAAVVQLSFNLVQQNVQQLSVEDVEDWITSVERVLDFRNGPTFDQSCFQLLSAFAKARPSCFPDVEPFVLRMKDYFSSAVVLSAALPFFMNIMSMNSLELTEESLPLFIAFLLKTIYLFASDVEVVQMSCFLINLARDKYDLEMPSEFSSIMLEVLSAQIEELGCARTCLKTLCLSVEPSAIFSSDNSASKIFGATFLNVFNLVNDNLDGLSLTHLVRLLQSFVSQPVVISCKEDLHQVMDCLDKYTVGSDALEDLMLSDDEEFVSICQALSASMDSIEWIEAAKYDFIETPVSIELPPAAVESKSSLPLVVRGEEAVISCNEYGPNASAATVEINEGKLMEMMHLLRHFQDHAGISFHRAELLQGLFLESSRKVEELLRENIFLKNELAKAASAPRATALPIADSSLGNAPVTQVIKGDVCIQDAISQKIWQILEKEGKVLQHIFSSYCAASKAMTLDSAALFSRDFGLCPALISPSDFASVCDEIAARSPQGGFRYDAFKRILVELAIRCDFSDGSNKKSPQDRAVELLFWLDTSDGLAKIDERKKTKSSASFRYIRSKYHQRASLPPFH